MFLILQRHCVALAFTSVFEGIGMQIVYNQFHIIRITENLTSFCIGTEVISYPFALGQTFLEQEILFDHIVYQIEPYFQIEHT